MAAFLSAWAFGGVLDGYCAASGSIFHWRVIDRWLVRCFRLHLLLGCWVCLYPFLCEVVWGGLGDWITALGSPSGGFLLFVLGVCVLLLAAVEDGCERADIVGACQVVTLRWLGWWCERVNFRVFWAIRVVYGLITLNGASWVPEKPKFS